MGLPMGNPIVKSLIYLLDFWLYNQNARQDEYYKS